MTKQEYDRKRYLERREETLAARREYYHRNKERVAEYGREYRAKNKDKLLAAKKKWYEENREQRHRRNIELRYGISSDEYESLLAEQNHACAICEKACGSGKRLCVDHDHDTGRIRGLLCAECNAGMGKLRDNAVLLRRAAAYLDRG